MNDFDFDEDMGKTLDVTFYRRPDGRKTVHAIKNIHADDAQWLKENDIAVSMEEIEDNNYAVYFDYGAKEDDDETPREWVELSNGRTCQAVFKVAVEQLRKLVV